MIGKLFEAFIQVCLVLPHLEPSRRDDIIEQWCREVLDVLRITVNLYGRPMPGNVSPVIFVANHVSWLDVLLLNACRRMHFVAKIEVRSWPLIGWIAAGTGTLFFKRTSPHQLTHVIQSMRAVLRRGDCIAFFPEGTTTDGTSVHPFHSALFEAAVQSKAMIQPLCIRYERSDGTPDRDLAFVGNESLVASILKILTRPITVAHLSFLFPVDSSTGDRRRLANLCQMAIARHLAQEDGYPIPSPHTTPLDTAHPHPPPVAAA